jgi:hypothetical protein
MTKVYLKFSLIALAIGVLVVSCGGRGGNQQSGTTTTDTKTEVKAAASSGAELKDVNEGNWQAVLKANFGVDYVLPAGWSFKEVYSPNGRTNLKLFLNIGGDTTGEDMGNSLFAQTKSLSKYGNFKGNVDWDAETVSAGDALADFNSAKANPRSASSTWNYTFNSRMVILNSYTPENIAEYTFTLN